ncbi:MAG: hypothetical protein CMH62_00390 [Nanoarchaeota archaeon]|nr:hypothetical protein [Nanoarchaeota archaeon]|tara:strand:- start:1139 stop:1378 length:240 start_codon:yes stop_codon:yes gene_type:complete
MIKNFKELEMILKNTFNKIRRDNKRLEEAIKNNMEDVSVIRSNLLEFNTLRKKIEAIEKKIGEVKVEEEKGFFSKIFRR